jgi:hypothetical protein
MAARGKHGKPTTGFPPFPPSLETPQRRRAFHIPTASVTVLYTRQGLTASPKTSAQGVGQIKMPKWAKISCQTQRRPGRTLLPERLAGLDNLEVPVGEPLTWYSSGAKAARLKPGRELLQYLSAQCDHIYHKAPRVLNELINRRNPVRPRSLRGRSLRKRWQRRPTSPCSAWMIPSVRRRWPCICRFLKRAASTPRRRASIRSAIRPHSGIRASSCFDAADNGTASEAWN